VYITKLMHERQDFLAFCGSNTRIYGLYIQWYQVMIAFGQGLFQRFA
jgi:hypothetical protein